MSNERLGLLVAAVAALVLAFVVLSPDGDDELDGGATPTTTLPATTRERGAQAQDEPPAAATSTTIRVQNGKPAGGVKTITVKKGERARIEVSSQDTSDEVHLHGYDITRDLEAGDSVRFSFDADAEGIFELELEGSHTQIGRLVVEP